MHEVSVFSDFLDFSITFIFLLSFLIILKQFLLPSTSPRLSSKIPCALRQGDGVYWRILLPHRLWAQGLLPHRDVRRVQPGVHDRATDPQATFLEDVDYDDAAIGEMLFKATENKSITPSEKGLSVGQSSSVSDRTGEPVVETVAESTDRTGQPVAETGQDLNLEHAQIRTLLNRQREQILAHYQAEIRRHKFQADYDQRSIQKSSETIESQQEELHRRDQQLLHEQLLKQNWDLREAHEKSLTEMEELKKFQSSAFDTIARRRLVEDQDTILELTGKIQELKNEINCMSGSRDFQDAESVRSGHSHVTSQLVSFPPHPILDGMLSRSIGMPSRIEGPPSIWDTHGISGNVFENPVASSTTLIRRNWIHGLQEYQKRLTHQQRWRMRIGHQFRIRDASPDRQPKIQSSSVEETLQRIMEQTNNDCRSQIFISTNSPRQQHLLVGR